LESDEPDEVTLWPVLVLLLLFLLLCVLLVMSVVIDVCWFVRQINLFCYCIVLLLWLLLDFRWRYCCIYLCEHCWWLMWPLTVIVLIADLGIVVIAVTSIDDGIVILLLLLYCCYYSLCWNWCIVIDDGYCVGSLLWVDMMLLVEISG